ncbi:hypothetical protein ACIA8H_23300 [Streptomyces goshikiensis]|uniref:hypothetical protein n=1 Tax=Streptomyces goshikiensis TaxID=1942 RepID=UPI0037B21F1F
MEFQAAHSADVLGPRMASIRRHGLYDPDWCLASVTEGEGRRQLDRVIRAEFARPGLVNSLWHWTVILKFDAQALMDRFIEIGHADRVALKLLPAAPRRG